MGNKRPHHSQSRPGWRGVTQALRAIRSSLAWIGGRRRDYNLIEGSGLFDAKYYLRQNRQVARSGRDPLDHFLDTGWREGRNPNPFFDIRWYLQAYPEVRESGVNPLLDYLRSGALGHRNPSSRFDSKAYLQLHPDVGAAGLNPLGHFLKWGRSEGRLPSKARSVVKAREAVLSDYDRWIAVNELSNRDIAELRERLKKQAPRLPKISLITPVYNTHPELLEELVGSVTQQVYEQWELCLINDGSSAPHVAPLLERIAKADKRVVVRHLATNGGVSAATNAGVEIATGEIVAFLDHDDLLPRNCLAEIALYYADHPEADIVYSDDDKIDLNGRRYAPQFKPDWSPTLLLSWMYFSHIFSVRKELFQRVGGFRSEFDGSQDYDFALRATDLARHVGHIPKVLYHWRAVEGSTARGGDAKPDSLRRGLNAVREALERRDILGAKAFHPDWAARAKVGMFDLAFADDGPSVSIVIVGQSSVTQLRACLESLRKTNYRNYEVLLVDDGSQQQEMANYLRSVAARASVRVLRVKDLPIGYSSAQLKNEGASQCSSDYLLFLNDDLEVSSPNWLSQMIGYAGLPGVAVVGARIHDNDGSLQHVGIVHGCNEGLVGNAFRGLPLADWGYLGLARNSREYSAVSSACLLTPREVFEELSGFDQTNFANAFLGVDYCYRVVKSGRTCVSCASAELRQADRNRVLPLDLDERANFRRLYGHWVDRWYNPNLSLENERFQIAAVRPATASNDPVRLVAVTHNLNNEGAPTTLLDLIIGLTAKGYVDPVVLSPVDGPLRAQYERAGIPVNVLTDAIDGAKDFTTQSVAPAGVETSFAALNAEVVLANTLQTYWAVRAAKASGVPSLWAQHESEPWETYFDYLPPDMRDTAYQAFAEAYRVLYVSNATRDAWSVLDTRRNFGVIRHGIPRDRLAEETSRWTHADARGKLGLPADAHVLSVVGTVCRRKGQLDLVEAYAKLAPSVRQNTYVFIAGRLAEPDYVEELSENIGRGGANVRLTGHVEDPFLYYAASDISICTSRVESAPRILLEAMACGLPIITTPVFGIPEIVRQDINALFYDPGDTDALAEAIEKLLRNGTLRLQLASNSLRVISSQPGFDEMVEQYGSLIRQAVNLKMEE